MAKNPFIRLNTNDNYLSLGNVFRIIKEFSNYHNTFWQPTLFAVIFGTDEIADSTVNNYCTGLRAIHPKYKSTFMKIKNDYKNDKTIFITIIGKILQLIENPEVTIEALTIEKINKNEKWKHICDRLYSISKNDSDVSILLSNELYKNLENGNFYNFFVQVLFYVILEKKQPIFLHEKVNEVIEKSIYETNISLLSIQDFLKIQLNSGIWSIRGIQQLAKRNNPFACFEMASMEYYGFITGRTRYEEAYNYYKIAADYHHPVANWAIGYLYYQGHIRKKQI